MKKIVILAAAVLATVGAASAQGFKFGVKAGANYANAVGGEKVGEGVDNKARIGFVAGAFAEYNFNEKMGLSADVLYSQQGDMLKQKEGNVKSIYKMDYINVPILFNYSIIEGLKVKAGIQPGFLMSAKNKVAADTQEEGYTGTFDMKDSFESLDLSIPVGVSYELPMGIVFDARYAIGMTKTYKKDALSEGAKNPKNGVASLTVGYKF